MKMQRLLRDVHHWGSIIVSIPLIVMIGAGLLLMLKKEIDWIQPPSTRAAQSVPSPDVPALDRLYQAASQATDGALGPWLALDRVDIKPERGIVKFVSGDGLEVQVSLSDASVLQVATRRSDVIEAIHDGSFFADWAKLWVFFPAGLILLTLWITGIYLFFLPHYKRWQRRKAKAV